MCLVTISNEAQARTPVRNNITLQGCLLTAHSPSHNLHLASGLPPDRSVLEPQRFHLAVRPDTPPRHNVPRALSRYGKGERPSDCSSWNER